VGHVDELIPAHALHALDADEERMVEDHLAGCARCRRRMRDYEAVAGTLAYAAPHAAPPPELRDRVLGGIGPPPVPAAAAPPRGRALWPRLAGVLVPAMAVALIALVAWNVSLRGDLDDTRSAVAGGSVVQLAGLGNAVAEPSGTVTLFADVERAPEGRTYAAWVIADGEPLPAGVFRGGGTVELRLSEQVRPGDVIAVTIEPEDADLSQGPSTEPITTAEVGSA
jgi:anti-sigma-K factor RskA